MKGVKITLLIFNLFSILNCFGQSHDILYTGNIYNEAKKPIQGAIVSISPTIKHDNILPTDANGYFFVKIQGNPPANQPFQLTITHELYATTTFTSVVQSAAHDKFILKKRSLAQKDLLNTQDNNNNSGHHPAIIEGTITLNFNLFDTSTNHPLINVRVSVMESQAISNNNGFVTLKLTNPKSDSVFVIIQDDNQGISFAKKYSKLNFPTVINLIAQEKREFTANNNTPVIDNQSSLISSVDFALTIRSMLFKVAFNSSIAQVLSYEYGNDSTKIDYDKLPRAIECTEDTIRYYWRYLKDSKLFGEIHSYFDTHHLTALVTQDSYVVYGFKHNKLVRINLRLFSSDSNFDEQFFKALTNNKVPNFISHAQIEFHGLHYIMGSSYTDYQSTEIFLCNDEGYNSCIHDWWHSN